MERLVSIGRGLLGKEEGAFGGDISGEEFQDLLPVLQLLQ